MISDRPPDGPAMVYQFSHGSRGDQIAGNVDEPGTLKPPLILETVVDGHERGTKRLYLGSPASFTVVQVAKPRVAMIRGDPAVRGPSDALSLVVLDVAHWVERGRPGEGVLAEAELGRSGGQSLPEVRMGMVLPPRQGSGRHGFRLGVPGAVVERRRSGAATLVRGPTTRPRLSPGLELGMQVSGEGVLLGGQGMVAGGGELGLMAMLVLGLALRLVAVCGRQRLVVVILRRIRMLVLIMVLRLILILILMLRLVSVSRLLLVLGRGEEVGVCRRQLARELSRAAAHGPRHVCDLTALGRVARIP